MKQFKLVKQIGFQMLICFASITWMTSCNKTDKTIEQNNSASRYSSDVIDKWITLQIRLMRDATGIPNQAFSRPYAYSGITAFEALGGGSSRGLKWNGLSNLPHPNNLKKYFSPASVNAALAFINRNMFTTATVGDKAAIDSLEKALNSSFIGSENEGVITQSADFGKSVAKAVFDWSETDGYKMANDPYIPPVGPGLWVPTPPAFAPPATPYWGHNRPTVAGSTDNTQPGPPIEYSENTKSEFYQMVKKLYDASQTLTDEQKVMALFWRDIPGVTSPGHWLSILQQVLKQRNSRLDKAALAYAVTGACACDALISCWQTKYKYNLVRPVTYIQKVFGFATWSPVLNTPAHPEYSSAHAVFSVAVADAFQALFGDIGSFTDHTYDYIGFAPRTFSSFRAIGEDAAYSRFYAGIHYLPSIEAGIKQGKKVTANIFEKLGNPLRENY